jgi:two-component system chemotaxis response regulator CheB
MINVLVVEDSPVIQEFLVQLLGSDPHIRVVATARNGEEALEALKRHQPDVITMDINMPRMNGFEATRRIMQSQPTPIVIVSGSWDPREVETTFQALEAGALAAVPRPMGFGHPEHDTGVQELLQTVKLMSEVKVVRRWSRPRGEASIRKVPRPAEAFRFLPGTAVEVIALGASTGGPQVLSVILSRLPKDFPIPILIVQHMAAGFIQGFAEWLQHTTGRPVRLGAHQDSLLPGSVTIAPDGFQMEVQRGGGLLLARDEASNGLCPAVSRLFRSVAEVYGPKAAGILLTGMGRDGAAELKLMKERGAVTFAQDEESSVVYGMPGEAVLLDAAVYVLPPEQIASALTALAVRPEREMSSAFTNANPQSR